MLIFQKKYTQDILMKFHIDDCKVMSTPMMQKEKLYIQNGEE